MNGNSQSINCAEAIVKMLEKHGVTHVFGVPGAKIDSLFIALKHSSIELVLVRHEQNAAFMAAAFGRLTGTVGVCIATSGPGVTNLVTGLATATSEGDPVLAIGGEAPVHERLKRVHQALDGKSLMDPVTKYSAEIVTADQVGEVIGNAIRTAETGRPGAVFVSLPKDIGLAPFEGDVEVEWGQRLSFGPAAPALIAAAAKLINQSARPVAILGMQSSQKELSTSLRNFFRQTGIPYIATFQGAGAWVQDQRQSIYAGRIGLFRNQPADKLLDQSDCVITIGYDPIEYDPSIWNTGNKRTLICVDAIAADQDNAFLPTVEMIGGIAHTLDELANSLSPKIETAFFDNCRAATLEIKRTLKEGELLNEFPVHPLRLVHELERVITDETHVALDVGSNYIWTGRYCTADYARQLLVSNGQQTLGVSIPWAIALSLLYPNQRVLSVSGDGGLLFTVMDLETAVRVGAKFVHVVWNSSSYDMVAFQEKAHYGETAGVELGPFDVVKLAEAFGCKGYDIKSAEELSKVLPAAFASDVPVIINVPVDYSDNPILMQDIAQSFIN